MADFSAAYLPLKMFEGGYSNNPADRGGETYAGVARNFFPHWDGWWIIDSMKERVDFPKNLKGNKELEESVERFFKNHFWDQFDGDDIPNQKLAEELLDISVNMGVFVAVTFLQRCLNVFNRSERDYENIATDGVFGPMTMNTLLVFLERSPKNGLLMTKALNCLQGCRYIAIMEKNESQETFARGWFSRVIL